jgi:hypothetical protein
MRIGTNLTPLDAGNATERPFLNELKVMGGYFTYTSPNGSDTGEEVALYKTGLDANGYCTSFSGFTFGALQMMINGGAWSSNPTGNYYVFMCDLNGGTPSFSFTTNSAVTSVDSSNAASGRWLLTTSNNGNPIRIWQTATGTPHATNFRLIWGGVENVGDVASTAGTGVGTTVGVNGVGTREALYNSNVAGGQPWGGFNPTFLAKMAPYSSIRFMDWGATIASCQVDWADRRPVGWVSYVDGFNFPTKFGVTPNPDQGGGKSEVPYEVMCALCNQLGVDMHICMPGLATDDFVLQLATFVHSDATYKLVSPHNVRVEYSNEVWNQGQFGVFLGTITASCAAGVLNVTSVAGLTGGKLFAGINGCWLEDGSNDGHGDSALAGSYPAIITSLGTGTGGTGTYNISRNLTFGSETINVHLNVNACMSNLDLEANNNGGLGGASNFTFVVQYGGLRAAQVGNIWKDVWGGDASRVIRLFGGWSGNNGTIQGPMLPQTWFDSTALLAATFTGTISGTTLTVSGVTNTITPHTLVTGSGVAAQTYIQSGSGTTWIVNKSQSVGPVSMTSIGYNGTLASNVDELCTAPYFSAYDASNPWTDMPYAWHNNLSVGVVKVANAVLNGGDIPYDGGGRTIHSADGGATYTLTSSLGLSGTPADMTIVSGTFDTLCHAGATIVVDSCSSFPLLSRHAAIGLNNVGPGYIMALCFNAIDGGWQIVDNYPSSGQYRIDAAVPGGSGVTGWIAVNYATAVTNGLTLSCYEGGQQFVSSVHQGGDLDTLWKNFWRSSSAYTVFLTFLQNMDSNATITMFHNFNDVAPFTFGEYWGAMEYITQTPNSPRYQAILDFTGTSGPTTPGTVGPTTIGMNSRYGVYKSRPTKIPLS